MPSAPLHWNTDDLMERAEEWIIDLAGELDVDVIRQLDAALPPREEGERWRGYELVGWRKEMDKVNERIRRLVLRETGIALLKCGSNLTSDQACLVQLLLGNKFGETITKTAQGDDRPLFSLQITDDPTVKGEYQGNGLKGNQIGFHTDGSGNAEREVELLSMLCIRQARFGGQSRVANSQLAFEWLPATTRWFLQQEFPRQNPYRPRIDVDDLRKAPVFRRIVTGDPEYLSFSYHPARVRNGIIKTKGFLTNQENDAFCLLEEALEKFSCDINLLANEILFLNNRVVAHDRRRFWDAPNAGRLLERYWAGTRR